jgi:phage terminase small subunit
MIDVKKYGRGVDAVSREELLARLAEVDVDDAGEDGLNGENESPDQGEAERLASLAQSPEMRIDGRPKGSPRVKPLTQKQTVFAQGLIAGNTLEAAYRAAYPDAQAKQSVIKSNAWKLSQDQRIKAMVEASWGETVEAMTDDNEAVKRYVIKELLHHSKTAKQEGTKLKALEMMGKSVGMFKQDQATGDDVVVTAEQLKRELAGHIRLMNNIKPMTRANVLEMQDISVIEPMPNAAPKANAVREA